MREASLIQHHRLMSRLATAVQAEIGKALHLLSEENTWLPHHPDADRCAERKKYCTVQLVRESQDQTQATETIEPPLPSNFPMSRSEALQHRLALMPQRRAWASSHNKFSEQLYDLCKH